MHGQLDAWADWTRRSKSHSVDADAPEALLCGEGPKKQETQAEAPCGLIPTRNYGC